MDSKQFLDKLYSTLVEIRKNNKKSYRKVLIGFVLSSVALAVIYFILWKKGREQAKLEHDLAIVTQNKKIAEADIHLSTLEAEKQQALKDVEAHTQTIQQLTIALEQNKREYAEANQKLNEIKSWSDVDSLLNSK